MKILFYLGHPAHFHLFKNLINLLIKNNNQVLITIKSKDVLEKLVQKSGYPYLNIYERTRKKNTFSILWALFQKDIRLYSIAKKFKPDVLLGTSIEITHVGKLIGKPAYIFNEDDAAYIKEFVLLGYPFARKIFIPKGVDAGKWDNKCLRYNGVQKLAYLHPNYFSPNKKIVSDFIMSNKPYALIRLSGLTAYHDKGIGGFTSKILKEVIDVLEPNLNVFISSESTLPIEFAKYKLEIEAEDIHHFLSFAHIFIGDSQSMSIEAAILGTYTIRFSGFAGRITVMKIFESIGLIQSISSDSPDELLKILTEIEDIEELKRKAIELRNRYLNQVTDVTQFFYKNLLNEKY